MARRFAGLSDFDSFCSIDRLQLALSQSAAGMSEAVSLDIGKRRAKEPAPRHTRCSTAGPAWETAWRAGLPRKKVASKTWAHRKDCPWPEALVRVGASVDRASPEQEEDDDRRYARLSAFQPSTSTRVLGFLGLMVRFAAVSTNRRHDTKRLAVDDQGFSPKHGGSSICAGTFSRFWSSMTFQLCSPSGRVGYQGMGFSMEVWEFRDTDRVGGW